MTSPVLLQSPYPANEKPGAFSSKLNTVIYYLRLNQFMMSMTIKVYLNRVSLEYRSGLGFWEHRETFNAIDIGNIYINKGRRWATVGTQKVNSTEKLFEIKGLRPGQAEELKDALDKVISYRFQVGSAQAMQSGRY